MNAGAAGAAVLAGLAVFLLVPRTRRGPVRGFPVGGPPAGGPATGGRSVGRFPVGRSPVDRPHADRPLFGGVLRGRGAVRWPGGRARPWVFAGGAVLAVLAFVPGPLAWAAAAPAGAMVLRWAARAEPAAVRAARARVRADLPVAADLLAACLAAGCPPADAADAVARAVGGPVADRIAPVVAALRLGGDPVGCWSRLADDAELAPVARAMARAEASGAAPAQTVARVADECREAYAATAIAAARAVGVRATVPLGVCFLPAFLLIGVVPVVAGLGGALMDG